MLTKKASNESLNKCDLSLSGDKIQLECRPKNKPINKSSLLTKYYSRPGSAMPALNLVDKDEYYQSIQSKRPFSANYILNSNNNESLPSSALLKNLLTEPIDTWKSENIDELSSISSDDKINEQQITLNLTPGLTKKPPLPRKSNETKKIDANDSTSNAISAYFNIKYECGLQKTEKDVENSESPQFESLSDSPNELLYQNWFNENENLTDSKKIVEKTLSNWSSVQDLPNFSDFDIEKMYEKSSKGNTEMETWISRENQNYLEENKEKNSEISSEISSYDDYETILKELEKENEKSQKQSESVKKLVNETLNEEKKMKSVSFTNENQLEEYEVTPSSNYHELVSFLDEIDRNCKIPQKPPQTVESTLHLDTIPKINDLNHLTNDELSHQIIDLSLRLKEKSSAICLLQEELGKLRQEIVQNSKQTDNIVREKLKQQKDEYEGVIKRHQKFIDQLIADKRTLNEQCEGLIREMKVVEDRFTNNLKAVEHKHQVEMQKMKEMQMAAEKMRRDRWIDTKTQKIKELTVKSIEPEIKNMEKRHEQELADVRALHKREIDDMELKAARKLHQQCESLRHQLVEEHEKNLAHEKDVMRQRFEQYTEECEQRYQEQRRRLLADHAARMAECEERESMAISERDKAIKQAQDEFEDRLQMLIIRHSNELKLLKETTKMEMETWQNNYKKQQTILLNEKETGIREQCRKERDHEIELVIERLENESMENRKQLEESTEIRIKRLKEKHAIEIKDLENAETVVQNKYKETKTKLLNAEEMVQILQSSNSQLEKQAQQYKEFSDKLLQERNNVKETIREEMKDEMEELRKELANVKNARDKELQQLYSRVKVSVARKDELLNELNTEHKALQEKCVYLENLLAQQRKEYLIK